MNSAKIVEYLKVLTNDQKPMATKKELLSLQHRYVFVYHKQP